MIYLKKIIQVFISVIYYSTTCIRMLLIDLNWNISHIYQLNNVFNKSRYNSISGQNKNTKLPNHLIDIWYVIQVSTQCNLWMVLCVVHRFVPSHTCTRFYQYREKHWFWKNETIRLAFFTSLTAQFPCMNQWTEVCIN